MNTRRILSLLLSLALVLGLSVSASAVNPNEVVIPEYSVADYTVPFATRLDAIDALKQPCSEQGTIVERSYTAPAYAVNEMLDKDVTIDKTLQIYLPYGYDESQSYNILYLLHGFVKLQVDAHAETLYHFGTFGNILLDFLLAGGLCILFGNRWLAGCWRWLMEAWRYFLREIKRR